MKIALVILHADPARGGAERYTVDLASALRQRGHDARLVSSSFEGGSDPTLNVRIQVGHGGRAQRYERFLGRVDERIAAERYDIVHAMLPVRRCDLYHPHAGLAAGAIASGHLKYDGAFMQVVSRVATRLNRRRQRFSQVERDLLAGPQSPRILCLSEYVKRSVRAHYALSDDRMPVLINAVNLARFDPALRPGSREAFRERLKIAPDKIVFLMIAQDFLRKGLAEAIEALARLENPRAVLLVAGRDDARPYRRLATQQKVGDRVFFAGPTSDPYGFYAAADGFVLPTRHDPCSLVVLESLAMGVPVISTTHNGATEAMVDGVHGSILADPSDVMALVRAMQRIADPAQRAEMRRACTELRPRLAYETHVDHLMEIYGDISKQRGRRS